MCGRLLAIRKKNGCADTTMGTIVLVRLFLITGSRHNRFLCARNSPSQHPRNSADAETAKMIVFNCAHHFGVPSVASALPLWARMCRRSALQSLYIRTDGAYTSDVCAMTTAHSVLAARQVPVLIRISRTLHSGVIRVHVYAICRDFAEYRA